jgi:hypothetical protein
VKWFIKGEKIKFESMPDPLDNYRDASNLFSGVSR